MKSNTKENNLFVSSIVYKNKNINANSKNFIKMGYIGWENI